MRVIKRDGSEAFFDAEKIKVAVLKANDDVVDVAKISEADANAVAQSVTKQCEALERAVGVEEIQDLVEKELIRKGFSLLMRAYTTYRWQRAAERRGNTTDGKILSLLERKNEEAIQENSNKNPIVNSTMRDYMAGEVSRDLVRRHFFPKDIIEAWDEGVLWLHDTDYISQPLSNCCLVNIEDMFKNGTVINGTTIETPKSFSTACNIACQIAQGVSNSQFGGQSLSLAHLAPFIDVSRKKFYKKTKEQWERLGLQFNEEQLTEAVEEMVKREITEGVQIIQYQTNTIMCSNGQTPFITLWMYLDEVQDGRTRDDLAMFIEEVLKQRIRGIKNEVGVWITPAFPKLIFCLDEDNIHEDSKYYYLTELAAKCVAKRMVPDFISAKVMKKLKNGDVYPVMGCRSALTPDLEGLNPDGSHKYYGRLTKAC